jgi:uncharacterized protein
MNPLHELIRRLPPRIEFLIVITWAFGLPIFSSILSIGDSGITSSKAAYSNAMLVSVLMFELVQSLFLVWFLRVRGWTLEKIGLQVTLRGTVIGGLLLGVLLLNNVLVSWLVQFLPLDMRQAIQQYPVAAKDLNMQLMFVVSVVNGAFEEVFVAGYVITALMPVRGMWAAINVSTGVRLLCHLYQGPIAFLVIVPMGLVFGYVFARQRVLWALIVAHVLIDIVAFTLGNSA